MLQHSAVGYRPDIDGLRAISVLAVVAYHVGLPAAPGGFVGVDVFFVISGFLITQLLLSELNASGAIDLLAFYARRARRLLPAFFLVVGATLFLSAIVLVPLDGEQPDLARSALYAAFYVSNLYFAARSADYFAAPAELQPLLHTWSLAVEEQFYLVWPAILIGLVVAARRFRLSTYRLVVTTLVVIAVGSFLFCWWASVTSGASQAGFYHAHARAWQLTVGALLAVGISTFANRSRLTGFVLTSGGLAAIVAAVSLYSPAIPYPGTAALLPSLGAAAILAGGSVASASAATRLLSHRPLVGLGKLSYSWYLWHWPLLSIARADALGEKDLIRDAAIAIAALGLAWLTFRYVEDPIRRKRLWGASSTRQVLGAAASATGCLLLLATGMMSWSKAVLSDSKGPYFQLAAADRDNNPRRALGCYQSKRRAIARWPDCTFPEAGAATQVLLWGDSHADHLMPLLEAAAGQIDFAVTQRTMSGCDAVNASENSACLHFNSTVEEELKRWVQQQRLTGVVLAGRWVGYQDQHALSVRRRHKHRKPDDRGRLGPFERELRNRVRALVALGLRVIVVAPMPEQRYDTPLCLARRRAGDCSVARAEAEAFRSPVLTALERAIDGLPNVRLVDLFPALCDAKICSVQRSGIILYRDGDHLTATGARSLWPSLAQQIRWVAEAELATAPEGSH